MKTENVMIPSSKGKISAVIHHPEKKSYKLAILCPGYLDSKDYPHITGLAKTLCEEGYTAVRFDTTGIWDSEGDISSYTTTQYLEDVKNVIEFMLKQAEYKHILVGGHSRGGQVSLLYAARDPRVSVAVAIMPSGRSTYDDERMDEWRRTGFSTIKRTIPGSKEKRTFNVPIAYSDDKDKYDVVADVKKIKVQTIFIAGEIDDSCPKEMIKEIFDSAHEPKRFVIMPKMGHDYRLSEHEIMLVDMTIVKLLKELRV